MSPVSTSALWKYLFYRYLHHLQCFELYTAEAMAINHCCFLLLLPYYIQIMIWTFLGKETCTKSSSVPPVKEISEPRQRHYSTAAGNARTDSCIGFTCLFTCLFLLFAFVCFYWVGLGTGVFMCVYFLYWLQSCIIQCNTIVFYFSLCICLMHNLPGFITRPNHKWNKVWRPVFCKSCRCVVYDWRRNISNRLEALWIKRSSVSCATWSSVLQWWPSLTMRARSTPKTCADSGPLMPNWRVCLL